MIIPLSFPIISYEVYHVHFKKTTMYLVRLDLSKIMHWLNLHIRVPQLYPHSDHDSQHRNPMRFIQLRKQVKFIRLLGIRQIRKLQKQLPPPNRSLALHSESLVEESKCAIPHEPISVDFYDRVRICLEVL